MSKHGPFGPNSRPNGPVAEWLCRGLQSPVRRFDSGPGLHTEGVTVGNAPSPPTPRGAGSPPMTRTIDWLMRVTFWPQHSQATPPNCPVNRIDRSTRRSSQILISPFAMRRRLRYGLGPNPGGGRVPYGSSGPANVTRRVAGNSNDALTVCQIYLTFINYIVDDIF